MRGTRSGGAGVLALLALAGPAVPVPDVPTLGLWARQPAPTSAASSLAWYEKRPAVLAPPSGRVVRVTSSAALAAAVAGLAPGTTVVVAAGRYRITAPLAMARLRDVAIRGETGRAPDVVIEGPGLHPPPGASLLDGIWTQDVRRLVLADFTIRGLPRHCVIFNAGTAEPTIHNVHFIDCGEQAVKANPDSSGRGVPGGVVEYSRFEYTTTSRGSYTNAISGIGAIGWTVRHTLFRNIRAPRGQLAGPALLFRGGARDTVVDANTFLECQRGVAFGMVESVPRDHSGGVIQNNFFHRSADQPGDTAFSLWNAPGARVIHNTVILEGTYHAAIDYRWAGTSELVIANNLLDASIWRRREASAATAGNVFGARPDWFRSVRQGDLHLTGGATGALNRAVSVPGVAAERDWDGDRRPASAADVGADQRTAQH